MPILSTLCHQKGSYYEENTWDEERELEPAKVEQAAGYKTGKQYESILNGTNPSTSKEGLLLTAAKNEIIV